MLVAQIGGCEKPQRDWVDPIPQMVRSKEALASIQTGVAQVFVELLKDGKVPSWVLKHVDVDLIKSAV